MAGGKETPRQRMIGILYLVLLGLIALSVPDSLLDAFKNIKNSLNTSTANVNESLKNTYDSFEKTKLKQEGERAQKLWDEAHKASAITKELDDYIEELKAELIKAGGGINPDINDVNARDNLDISPRIMISDKKADVLKQKIEDTKKNLLELLGDDQKGINFSLDTQAPITKAGTPTKTWQEGYFGDGIPLGATLTTLAKIQADNKNAENEVVKKLLGKVDKAEINLDQFKAVVVAPSSYIIAGNPYTAEVFLTAYDKNSKPDIVVDGRSVPVVDGKGQFSSVYGEGVHKFTATVSVKGTDGKVKTYTSDPVSLTVARPSAVVSADKMNVLYIGVPNPISVSAPGVPKESIKVSISAGEITGANGAYVANVKSVGTAKISVTGDKNQPLGFMEFRTKRIPPPKAQFAGKSGGSTSAGNIKGQERIFAVLDGFDFAAKFNITHYQLLIQKPRAEPYYATGSGGELTPDMKKALTGVTPGTIVIFSNITAVGPDGLLQEVDPIAITAN
jgi:gliding motility-associated protein GldM